MSSLVRDPWVLAVRARRLLAKTTVRRALVGVVAAATGLAVMTAVQAAERASDRWGATREVVVARRDLAVGETVDESAVERRDLPSAMVPDAALADVAWGAVVRQPIAAGEALVEDRLAPDGLTGVAALVPAGSRAVAIPVGPVGAPPLLVGDQVDVVAVLGGPPREIGGADDDPTVGAAGEPAGPLVERATVVDVRDEAVSVAVPAIDVPAVVTALAQGAVVLTLAGA